MGSAASADDTLVNCSCIAIVSVSIRIFLLSLDSVDNALKVSEIALTKPRVLVTVPAPMVIDSGVSARVFADSRDSESIDDIVSDSERILAFVLVSESDIVIVSVSVLTMLLTPAFDRVSMSDIVMV